MKDSDTCQLLTLVDGQTAVRYLQSDRYAAQQKLDGKRIILAIDRNSVTAHNREGLVCEVSKDVVQQARVLAPVAPLIFDCEWLQQTKSLHVFDLLKIDGNDFRALPFHQRHDQLCRTLAVAQLPNILPVRTEYESQQKIALLQRISEHNLEGIVLKPLAAPYRVGRQNDHFKYKFTAVSSFLVIRLNQKQSVALGAYDENGKLVDCGDVKIRNSRFKVREGMIIDVEYAHAFKNSNRIFQPRMKVIRDDLRPEACTLSQLRFKGTEITVA